MAILSRNLMYMDTEKNQLSWHYSYFVEKIGGKAFHVVRKVIIGSLRM